MMTTATNNKSSTTNNETYNIQHTVAKLSAQMLVQCLYHKFRTEINQTKQTNEIAW